MMLVAISACAVCLLMALVRTMRGPTAFDRVLAVKHAMLAIPRVAVLITSVALLHFQVALVIRMRI